MSGSSQTYESCWILEESAKKGLCFLELRRNGMVQWSSCGLAGSVDQQEGFNPKLSSLIVKEEQNDDEETDRAPSSVLANLRKRKRIKSSKYKDDKSEKCHDQKPTSTQQEIKLEKSIPCKKEKSKSSKKWNSAGRWSIERYKVAEKHMLDVMKALEATFENPLSRKTLRDTARKRIGDTGLLDHLLKHIDGKLAPGGAERFRRCYNTEGSMEYWLESADLVKIKREAGVPDPTWVPPSGWTHGSVAIRESVAAGELKLLKEEIAKLKRDMGELSSKNQERNWVNPEDVNAEQQFSLESCDCSREMRRESVKWRSKTEEISKSLSGVQDMYRELMAWKSKTEQQLAEISNSLSSMVAPKQYTTFSPVSERWEDWLESTNLDNIQGEDLAPWLGSADLVNVGQDTAVQEGSVPPQPSDSLSKGLVCARDLELLREEMDRVKRDVQVLLPKRVEDAQASVTPDSSISDNSKVDVEIPIDNRVVFLQDMYRDTVEWKAKIEKQMADIVNAVNAMQAKQ